MKKLFPLIFIALQGILLQAQTLRPPAYPLINHDPYFSIWSFTDTLNTSPTRHWTGADQSLIGLIKVDGNTYRFLGKKEKVYQTVLPASDEENYQCQYTETEPAAGWMNPQFDDSQWKMGTAPFGDNTSQVKTPWLSKNIWMRRSFTLDDTDFNDLFLKLRHDDNAEVYLNGEKIYNYVGWLSKFQYFPMGGVAKKKLKKGKNVLAIHVANTTGGSWLDAGIVHEPIEKQEDNIIAAQQKSVDLNPTQTIYEFTCGKVDVTLTFTSPLLMDDLDILSRPVSYISYQVKSNDGASHDVQVYFGASTDIAVNVPSQEVATQKYDADQLSILKAGTKEQAVLQKKGDDLRIDWGYMYVAVPKSEKAIQYVASSEQAIPAFTAKNTASASNTTEGRHLMLNTVFPLEKAGSSSKDHFILLAYDDQYAVQYFGEDLRPWWRREEDMTAEKMLSSAAKDYNTLRQQCEQFDKKLYQDALHAGGKEYAALCELAYRQAIAAHKVVARKDGTLLFFSKENFSNGSIGTVDVTYPSAPLFILYNPELMKGMLRFIFEYSESGRWKKPFAAHDVGTYPLANGQTYGEDMPVEESGNMIILTAAIAAREKNAAFAQEHWETLTTWAQFLKKEGFDPANQLSTDDFAGHLARNANLSVKAIMGLASYGKLAGMLGKKEVEKEYTEMAKGMAKKWMEMANDGDHYTLAFGSSGTWSQKYNLVWDKVLDLNIFPASVREKEIAYYKKKQQTYGLPLDSRKTYTKSDWILWTATLADKLDDFKTLVHPVWKFANETPDRIPLSDWHETTNAESVGFRARSVVGGYFIKMLEDKL